MPDLAQNERQKRTFFTTKPKNRIIMAENDADKPIEKY